MTVALTLDSLLSVDTKTVDIPGVGVIKIKPISAKEYDAVSEASKDESGERDSTDFAARVIASCMVEPFVEDYSVLKDLPIARLWAIFDEVNSYTGLDEGEVGERVDQFPVSGNPED